MSADAIKNATTKNVVDYKFEIYKNPEPDDPASQYLLTMYEIVEVPADEHWPVITQFVGEVVESFWTDDPFGAVEAFRETQEFDLEERLSIQWEREQKERGR